MGHYQYTAVDTGGAVKSGRLEAASTQAVVDQLMREALTPIRVSESSAGLDWGGVLDALQNRSNRLPAAELLGFTRQLASLLRSGLTLERSLVVLQQLSMSRRQARFSQEILQRVRRGASLSESLNAVGVPLPGSYVSLVRAGEASGALPAAMTRLTQLLEQSYETRERLLSAMVYPAILLATIGLTLILIVTFVLPRFESLFDEAGAKLPLATRVVMVIGSLLRNEGWMLLGIGALGVAALQRALNLPERRQRIDRALLRLGWYRNTVAKADAARFARTLGMLASGGVPLTTGFRIAVNTLHNAELRRSAERALEGVSAGRDLAEQLHRLGGFPPLLLQMVRVGFETGRLHETLVEAADILDDESRRALERSVAVAVPMVTIVMGLLVAGLIGSVLVGILSINDLAD